MSDELARAIELFNRGEYFAAAEHFEGAFAHSDDQTKELAGALNRIAAALHLRFERGARQGPINLLSHAMLVLDDLRPTRAGVDVERLAGDIQRFTERIRAAPRDERIGIRRRARIFVERRRAPKIHTVH
jgi:hypothetical protein